MKLLLWSTIPMVGELALERDPKTGKYKGVQPSTPVARHSNMFIHI
jgi:hypothetical protein